MGYTESDVGMQECDHQIRQTSCKHVLSSKDNTNDKQSSDVHSLLTCMTCGTEMQGGDRWWQHEIDKWVGVVQVCQHHNISVLS